MMTVDGLVRFTRNVLRIDSDSELAAHVTARPTQSQPRRPTMVVRFCLQKRENESSY